MHAFTLLLIPSHFLCDFISRSRAILINFLHFLLHFMYVIIFLQYFPCCCCHRIDSYVLMSYVLWSCRSFLWLVIVDHFSFNYHCKVCVCDCFSKHFKVAWMYKKKPFLVFHSFFLFIPVHFSVGGATLGAKKYLLVGWNINCSVKTSVFILDWIQMEEAEGARRKLQ